MNTYIHMNIYINEYIYIERDDYIYIVYTNINTNIIIAFYIAMDVIRSSKQKQSSA